MLRALAFLFIGLLLCACGDNLSDAKEVVEESLGIRKPEFHNISEFPGNVVCGEYVLKTSDFSTALDREVFITVRGRLYQPPSQQDWDFFCNETPGQILFSKTGIGPYTAGNKELARITADMAALTDALESYYRDHDSYPTMAQGLQALAEPPNTLKTAERYRDGGYLQAIPADPWGRPYLYQEEQWGRTKGSFTITTLGASGVEGGDGDDADINTSHLKYLQHLAVVTKLK